MVMGLLEGIASWDDPGCVLDLSNEKDPEIFRGVALEAGSCTPSKISNLPALLQRFFT